MKESTHKEIESSSKYTIIFGMVTFFLGYFAFEIKDAESTTAIIVKWVSFFVSVFSLVITIGAGISWKDAAERGKEEDFKEKYNIKDK